MPFQVFAASDGWLVIGCAKEKFWKRLVEAIDEPELGDNPHFRDFASRFQYREELLPKLEEKFRSGTLSDWLEKLRDAGVPCAPVNSVEQALADEHTLTRGLVVDTEHPKWGIVKTMASPVRVGPSRLKHQRAPFRNESADYLLSTVLGYSQMKISELGRLGAFGEVLT